MAGQNQDSKFMWHKKRLEHAMTSRDFNKFATQLKSALRNGYPIDYGSPYTLLHSAITQRLDLNSAGGEAIINLLLEEGADVNITPFGENILMQYIYHMSFPYSADRFVCSEELLERLISQTTDVNYRTPDQKHLSALDLVVLNCAKTPEGGVGLEVIGKLIAAGAEFNQNVIEGWEEYANKYYSKNEAKEILPRLRDIANQIEMYLEQQEQMENNDAPTVYYDYEL